MGVYVFVGCFNSLEEALSYSEEQWETEPDESSSEEEFIIWQEKNPSWQMATDLDCYLDSDFIETIASQKYSYLRGMLLRPEEIEEFKEQLEMEKAVMVLIFESAINHKKSEFASTDKIDYLGFFESTV